MKRGGYAEAGANTRINSSTAIRMMLQTGPAGNSKYVQAPGTHTTIGLLRLQLAATIKECSALGDIMMPSSGPCLTAPVSHPNPAKPIPITGHAPGASP